MHITLTDGFVVYFIKSFIFNTQYCCLSPTVTMHATMLILYTWMQVSNRYRTFYLFMSSCACCQIFVSSAYCYTAVVSSLSSEFYYQVWVHSPRIVICWVVVTTRICSICDTQCNRNNQTHRNRNTHNELHSRVSMISQVGNECI
jgi:hypothetical protein